MLLYSNANANAEEYNKSDILNWLGKYKNNISNYDLNYTLDYVSLISNKKKIDPILILSIISYESGFHKKVISKTGAIGLMQVNPKWHKDKIKDRNIFRVANNLEVGTTILKECIHSNGSTRKGLGCYSGYKGINRKKYINTILSIRRSFDTYILANRSSTNKYVLND